MCAAVALSFLFTGAWQATAVIIAAEYEVGLTEQPIVLALVALVVAIAVVMFDWTIIQSHLRGSVGRKTWFVRMVFTVCMIFLVSEVVASAMFQQDIQNQLAAENKTKADALSVELKENQKQMDGGLDKIAVLDQRINQAADRVKDAHNRMVTEENGYGRRAGRWSRYNIAKLDMEKAQEDLDAAHRDRDSQGAEQEERLASLKQQNKDARTAADENRIVKLGPGNREELLWTYLLANPSALFFKRLPLAVILICLDTFALLIGLTISRRTRELHEG